MTITGKEIFNMQEDINFLKKKAHTQGENLAAQGENITAIKVYLLGDDYHQGFKQQNEGDRIDIKDLKAFKQRLIYSGRTVGAIITTAGIIFAIVKNWTSIFG